MNKYIVYYESDWTKYATIINGTIDDVYHFIGKEALTSPIGLKNFWYKKIENIDIEKATLSFLEERGFRQFTNIPSTYYRRKQQ